MSGYLQRLVRMVTHPEVSVHPRVGSLFSPHICGPSAVNHGSDEPVAFTESVQPVPLVPHGSVQTVGFPASAPTSPFQSQRPPIAPNTVQGQMAAGPVQDEVPAQPMPLLGKASVPEPLLSGKTERFTKWPAVAAGVPAPLRRPSRTVFHNAIKRPGPVADVLEDVLRPATRPSRLAAERRDESLFREVPIRERPPADRELDEIQIHIGRIEVTAVPLPVPKATKPSGKELSLDEYLKRRDRRP